MLRNAVKGFYLCAIIILSSAISSGDDGAVFIEHTNDYTILDTKDLYDWEIELGRTMVAPLNLADIDGDGVLDIVGTTLGTQSNPRSDGNVFVIDITGNFLPGWPFETLRPISVAPAIDDVDKDGYMEIVAADWQSIYLLNHDGTVCSGWPKSDCLCQTPAIADIDDNGYKEIIYTSENLLYIRHHNGYTYGDFPLTLSSDLTAPAIGDLDLDGELEIVAATELPYDSPDTNYVYAWKLDGSVMAGFPTMISGYVYVRSAPALGDVDDDGYLDIVVGAYCSTEDRGQVYCINHQGETLSGWPVPASYIYKSSPALADIDDDEKLEVFIGGMVTDLEHYFKEIVYGFNYRGVALPNWPVLIEHEEFTVGNIDCPTIVAEVDNNSNGPEIFVKVCNNIFGFNSDGSHIEGFPYAINDDGYSSFSSPSPAIGDLDNDGDVDLIFASLSTHIYYLDRDDEYDEQQCDWPLYKHDHRGTSRRDDDFGTDIIKPVSLPYSMSLSQNYPNPFNAQTTISFTIDTPGQANLSLYDLLGRQVSTLVDGNLDAGNHEITYDASSLSSGIYFYTLTTGGHIFANRMTLIK